MRIEFQQDLYYGPLYSVRVSFEIEFLDGTKELMYLYYPDAQTAFLSCKKEIKQVKKVLKQYSSHEYRELLAINSMYFLTLCSSLKQLFSYLHKWEREMWSLPSTMYSG